MFAPADRMGIFGLASAALPAPGGVDTNLQLWLKADTGFTPSQWNDQSGNSNHATQATAGNQPAQISNGLNANPTVRFSGNQWMQTSSNVTVHEVIAVIEKNTAGGPVAGSVGGAFSTGYIWRDINGQRLISGDLTGRYLYANTAIDTTAPNILTLSYNAVAANARYGLNGQTLSAQVVDGGLGSTGSPLQPFTDILRIGTSNASNYLDGDIAEFIVYAANPSTTDRQKIESYLALKYGITLNNINYLNSAGATIWDSTANSAWHNDVTGIGVDANSALSRLASRSVNSDNIVAITGTLASMSSGEFLLWGNDNGATTASSEVPSGYSQRLTREWKVAETGEVGTVTIAFDLTGLSSIDLSNPTGFALLTDADGNFSNATATAGASVSGNVITFTGVNLSNGQFFSLAYPIKATYDFANLSLGDLLGQDSWQTSIYNTTTKMQVVDTGFGGSRSLRLAVVGANVGSSLARKNDANFSFPSFANNSPLYVYEMDIVAHYWGIHGGIGYDTGNSKTTISNYLNVIGMRVSADAGGSGGRYKLTAANGTVYDAGAGSTTADNGDWVRVRVVMDLAANSGQGAACMLKKNLTEGATTWTELAAIQNVNMGLDAARTATDKTNPNNWNAFAGHADNSNRFDTIAVSVLNRPTSIVATSQTITENLTSGTTVGVLSASLTDSYTYSLVS